MLLLLLIAFCLPIHAMEQAIEKTVKLIPTASVIAGLIDEKKNIAWNPQVTSVVSGSYDATICYWDIEKLREPGNQEAQRTLIGHTDFVRCVAFHPNGSFFLSGSTDKTVRLWHIEAKKRGKKKAQKKKITSIKIGDHPGRVNTVLFSPNGNWAFSVCDGHRVIVWDMKDLTTPTQQGIFDCVSIVCPSNQYALIANPSGRIVKLKLADKIQQEVVPSDAQTRFIFEMNVDSQGNRICVRTEKMLKLYALSNVSMPLCAFSNPENFVSFEWGPTGNYGYGTETHQISLFSSETNKFETLVYPLHTISAIVWRFKKGNAICLSADHKIYVLTLANITWQQIGTSTEVLKAMVKSPDDEWLFTLSNHGKLRLFRCKEE